MAYQQGIFPWHSFQGHPLWWSPNPRAILWSDHIHCARSLQKVRRQSGWRFSVDAQFVNVIQACAEPRAQSMGETWLSPELQQAFIELHQQGRAHSVEVYWENVLVGGLYGLRLEHVFCGESMFSRKSNASKLALLHLGAWLCERGIRIIDCQIDNPHLQSLGSQCLPRDDFLRRLAERYPSPLEIGH